MTIDFGEPVSVHSPGRWNLEEGPDFLDATLLLGNEQRRITGDVEIHTKPGDWLKHGHDKDPRYSNVIAHVTYYPGDLPSGTTPASTVTIHLKKALNPLFCFDNVDITAYPFQARSPQTLCSKIISGWTPEKTQSLLTSAGVERLKIKAKRISTLIREKGIEQAFYETLMRSLGYKKNSSQFTKLADLLPINTLIFLSENDALKAYAILCGVSGLLPEDIKVNWEHSTKKWVRSLWDIWWKHQSKLTNKCMSKSEWSLSGIRPQNHPSRRLMAAACLFISDPPLDERINALSLTDPKGWFRKVTQILGQMPETPTYLNDRAGVNFKQWAVPVSYIGPGTAAAIISNVIVPFNVAMRKTEFLRPDFLAKLPPETDNSIIRQTGFNLLGPDHNPALLRHGIIQQGLIQVFQDFCLNDRSGCSLCSLAKQLDKFQTVDT
ncbi:MAG: DUF2851 family protein [Lentisphaerae bacterium]|nr:DUF2851 family protein [Lentisphaerota bacterium]